MFESIHNETFTTPTQSKLSTSTSSIPLDKLQKDVQRKEEQYVIVILDKIEGYFTGDTAILNIKIIDP